MITKLVVALLAVSFLSSIGIAEVPPCIEGPQTSLSEETSVIFNPDGSLGTLVLKECYSYADGIFKSWVTDLRISNWKSLPVSQQNLLTLGFTMPNRYEILGPQKLRISFEENLYWTGHRFANGLLVVARGEQVQSETPYKIKTGWGDDDTESLCPGGYQGGEGSSQFRSLKDDTVVLKTLQCTSLLSIGGTRSIFGYVELHHPQLGRLSRLEFGNSGIVYHHTHHNEADRLFLNMPTKLGLARYNGDVIEWADATSGGVEIFLPVGGGACDSQLRFCHSIGSQQSAEALGARNGKRSIVEALVGWTADSTFFELAFLNSAITLDIKEITSLWPTGTQLRRVRLVIDPDRKSPVTDRPGVVYLEFPDLASYTDAQVFAEIVASGMNFRTRNQGYYLPDGQNSGLLPVWPSELLIRSLDPAQLAILEKISSWSGVRILKD